MAETLTPGGILLPDGVDCEFFRRPKKEEFILSFFAYEEVGVAAAHFAPVYVLPLPEDLTPEQEKVIDDWVRENDGVYVDGSGSAGDDAGA